jgi:hypothetical protein
MNVYVKVVEEQIQALECIPKAWERLKPPFSLVLEVVKWQFFVGDIAISPLINCKLTIVPDSGGNNLADSEQFFLLNQSNKNYSTSTE